MNFRLPGIFTLVFCLSNMTATLAAPANDDCSKAFPLRDVTNWCSSPRQFTNFAATASGDENPGCFPSYLLDADNDVWFKFTAVASAVSISVTGAIATNPGGTLQNPQFAVYRGSCSSGLREIACISDGQGYHIVETMVGNLAIGETYYLRVDGRNNKTGTFQLCVNNFNPVPSPSSDCSSAVVLCDKSPFTVPSVTSAGFDRRELPPGICVPEESQSVWYKWTCDQPGSLTFTLKPVNPSDDLDFVLFALLGGVDNCSLKVPVRCMASGENVGAPYSAWARCSGATGLRSGEPEISEDQGCGEFDNNFVAPLMMEAGKSYALMVNNYHNTGNGFSIEFGGTGTFAGPVAHFTVSKLKIPEGEKLWVKNASSFPGGIKNWEWNFGVGAKPQSAKGIGPHGVEYSSAGKKSISLLIETGNGCQVTKVRTIQVVDAPPPPPPPVAKQEPVKEPEKPAVKPAEEPAQAVSSIGPASMPPPPDEPMTAVDEPEKEDEEDEEIITPGQKSDTVQVEVEYAVKYEAVIYFKADSSSLEEKDIEILEEVLKTLQANPQQIAFVEGHTNNIPSDEYCTRLGTNRANSVIDWLQGQGIEKDRLFRKVFGKKRVVTKDYSLQNRRRNQRVEIKIMERNE
jgi:outer membrane protein OmpA-like peptidoglycan-associated protein